MSRLAPPRGFPKPSRDTYRRGGEIAETGDFTLAFLPRTAIHYYPQLIIADEIKGHDELVDTGRSGVVSEDGQVYTL